MHAPLAITSKVSGVDRTVDVDGDIPLLWVLRDVLGMTGTRFGLGAALCGACTVHINGAATRSCGTPIEAVGYRREDGRALARRLPPDGHLAQLRGRWARLAIT